MSADLTAGQVNLSDSGFGGRPFEERDAAFRVLRDQRPVAFFDEPRWPLPAPGPGHWELTRFDDVVEASKESGGVLLRRRIGPSPTCRSAARRSLTCVP